MLHATWSLKQATHRSLLAIAVLLVAAGCTKPAAGSGEPESTDVAIAPVTSYVRVGTTTTVPTAPPDQVAACVEYTQIMAFIGDPESSDRWNAAGMDEATLWFMCEQLWSTDPTQLATFPQRLADVEAYIEASQVTSAPAVIQPLASVPPQTAPPATAPPQTAPPATNPPVVAAQQNNCDPNYSGACVPIASDVDCAGGSGNGPEYVSGPVQIVGVDVYGLDGNDNDGIGCE